MAYDPGAIDSTLAAAVGDEPALIAELHEAFLDSAKGGVKALETAVDPDSWRVAAWRLKGLAASFGAISLMQLATDAAEGDAFDTGVLKRVKRTVERL